MRKVVLLAMVGLQMFWLFMGYRILPAIGLIAIAGSLGVDLWQKRNDYE